MDFEIRRYASKDQKAVYDLHIKALKASVSRILGNEWDEDLKRIEEVYLSGGGEFLVVLNGERIIAMGALRRLAQCSGEIKRMRVDPDFQRRGIGQLLLDRLLERARSFGYKKIVLDTTTEQLAAQRLYEKNDFTETHREYVEGLEVIYYDKRLQ